METETFDETPRGTMLLVIPPCFLNPSLDFEIGFPVHLLLLGQVVREQGWQVAYLDMTLEEKEGINSLSKLESLLNDPVLRVVGISNHTVRTSVTTKDVAERIKVVRPDVHVVVGGVNATFMWRELLAECGAIDSILRGYAQVGLRKLLHSLHAGLPPQAPGLANRRNGSIYSEPMVAVDPTDFVMKKIDEFPVARYLEWTSTYPLLTHTGCGFSCNFCTAVMPGPYQNREVYRNPKDVIDEMQNAIALGFDRFFMSANVFTSQRERCLDLCQALAANGIPEHATWVCMTRVELVDEELLVSMRRAGCMNVAFGVESAGKEQWEALKKGRYREATVRKAFLSAKSAGIGTTAFLMLGAPEQTIEDIEATAQLVRELDPEYRVISFFQPFPGTVYWEKKADFGLSEIAPLENWNFHEAPICRTRLLSKEYLQQASTRIHLDRWQKRVIDIERDYLHLPENFGSSSPSEDEVYIPYLEKMARRLPVRSLLDEVELVYGVRARLIALYHLSGLIAAGVVHFSTEPLEDPHQARSYNT